MPSTSVLVQRLMRSPARWPDGWTRRYPVEIALKRFARGYGLGVDPPHQSLGYPSMSRQTLGKLASTDPDWPVPKAQWRRIGPYWQVPWPPVRDYLANRDTRPGPKGRPRSRRHPGTATRASRPSKDRPVNLEPWTRSSEATRGTADPLPPRGSRVRPPAIPAESPAPVVQRLAACSGGMPRSQQVPAGQRGTSPPPR